MKNSFKFTFIGLLSCILFSCTEVAKKTQEIVKENNSGKLEGKFFPLESEGIKIFLPKEFNRISKNEYFEILEKSNDTTLITREIERFENVQNANLNIYLFEFFQTQSVLNVFTTDYFKFNKNDAQMLLNQLKYENNKNDEITGFTHNKIEARFFETKEAQIFKAIYKLEKKNEKIEAYKQIYLVSFNKKSFFLTLETPFLVDFDPYLEKIRVL